MCSHGLKIDSLSCTLYVKPNSKNAQSLSQTTFRISSPKYYLVLVLCTLYIPQDNTDNTEYSVSTPVHSWHVKKNKCSRAHHWPRPCHPNAYCAYGMPDHNNKTVTAATGSLASAHVVGPRTGVWILRSGSGGASVIT